ncbi:putative mitochondrial import protein [Chloropicon primus]|uniref:Putative mitochondrial import protein n=1 Tax=Chloropicon primus TaxID=1764295 RepID=A0A5B8MEW3_9CHLO|nr:putative mitochondrial import protein [Chloropicon primus]UPQ97087.1 putative mitochondrial import protein [Chloropicon primus]|eukprot:QDZ17872.1 putative mitochondrial import protein [Chloropicon primus]
MWTVVCRGPAGRRWIGRCEARGRLVPSPGKVRARIEVRNQPSRLAGLRATQADDDDFSGRIKFTSTRSSDEQLKRETLEPGSGSPRRTARVAFTCDRCGGRTIREVNPHALAKGTIFVQCSHCDKYHHLVDNLELIEEYNFKEERDE